MTREEFEKLVNKFSMNSIHYQDNVSVISIDRFNKISQVLYDDFESRTCENCKYGEYEKNINAIYCPYVNYCGSDYLDQDFGCSKWESK